MDKEAILREVRRGITQFAESRICSFGGCGTGNVIVVKDRMFIATCKHVVDDFKKAGRHQIVMRNNHRIAAQDLRLVAQTSDFDMALVEVMCDHPPIKSYSLENLEVIEDFAAYNFGKTNLHVCGLPSDLNVESNTAIYYTSMSFVTIPYEGKPNTEDYLYATYQIEKTEPTSKTIQVTSEISVPAPTLHPKAPGLSGSFVFKFEPFDGRSPELWTPDYPKAIAMQIAWDGSNYLTCVNIKHLVKMINGLVSP